jgi:hypothetical protein
VAGATQLRARRHDRYHLARWQLKVLAHLHSPTQGAMSESATQSFVCQADGAIIIVFAGTDILALAVRSTLSRISCATPFRRGIPGVCSWPAAAWARRSRPLAAFRLHELAHIEADHVYTFGLPLSAASHSATAMSPARTFRLVNGDDPVPAVPPPLLKFSHVGRSLFCPHGVPCRHVVRKTTGQQLEPAENPWLCRRFPAAAQQAVEHMAGKFRLHR